MEQLDFLAIGDIVADEFIRLKDASVHCKLNNEECEICMRWGDKIPFEFAKLVPAVGNSANGAVAAARLGLRSALASHVGEDMLGHACLDSLTKDHVATDFVERVPGKNTNHHYVLWFDSERTILIKHELFEYAMPTVDPAPKWLYLSSLGENSLPFHQTMAEWLASHAEVKLAFQPGTYQMQFGKEALADIYKRSEISFCNKEEAERILGIEPTQDIKNLLTQMHALGPKNVVITDGRNGAYALEENGSAWFVPMYPDPRAPYERTGAGDAFASSTVAAMALGKPLAEALLWGPINSMEVVQKIGAQEGLLTREKLEDFLAKAPAEYALKQL